MVGRAIPVLLAVLLQDTASALTPSIAFITGPEVIKDLGETAELECKVENGEEYPINWIKSRDERVPNYFTLSTGKTLAVKDERIKIGYESATSSYTLTITDIQDIDAAKYQCQVIVGIDKKISKEVVLQVRIPASISGEGSPDLTVEAEKDLELKCPSTGFPKPRVEWRRKDGQPLPGTSSASVLGEVLKIRSVRREDKGEYSCTASNNVGEPVTKIFNVKVRFGPSIRVPRPRIQQAVSHGVTLTCDIEAFPTPAIHWTKNGATVENDGTHTVVHFSRATTLIATSVKISSLGVEHYGTYECYATNPYGQANQKLELIRTKMPIPEAAYDSGSGVLQTTLVVFLLSAVAIFLY